MIVRRGRARNSKRDGRDTNMCPRDVMVSRRRVRLEIACEKDVWMKKQLTRFTTSIPAPTAAVSPPTTTPPPPVVRAIARGHRGGGRTELRGNTTARGSLHEAAAAAAIKERLTSMRRSPARE